MKRFRKMNSLVAVLLAIAAAPAFAGDLTAQFATPPASARPWVYWFWNNGNVTKVGITADLEAMKRAGIGGVIIMDVVERFAPPRGTAEFMNPEWQELFRFSVAEAKRLGLEINMTNGPGWCGSSGPWITPELSMQVLISSNTSVNGPANFNAVLPRPAIPAPIGNGMGATVKYDEYYRDVAVLAYPDTPEVSRAAVLDLTSKLDATGRLNWQAPAGKWIVQRIGHTTTGSSTRPPVAGGNGLECDKLSRAAMDAQFNGMLGKLIADVGPDNAKALTATHIDSWEEGGQNWTPLFRQEFLKRRGYDPIPFLPDVIDNGGPHTVGDKPTADRFRWDFRQTVSELLVDNYSGRLAELAHRHGMRLSIEGYDLPMGDEATYTAAADEPMTEFWTVGVSPYDKPQSKARQMASVAHIYGRPIVGAESFTSGDNEKWMLHPATIKSLGDLMFTQGVSRFVIHRYAHQPYLDRAPGATMGPWGLHYERTQTWWEMSSAWHSYLSRCQFMLRQGKFVADLCYLRPEEPQQTYFIPSPAVPDGYSYDECSADALMKRVKVKDGRLVLPDGMSYRLLVVAPVNTMTPALARKLKQLVADGATILVNGPHPLTSPSLTGFPQCDEEVARLTSEIWGSCDGKTNTERAFGHGRLIWGQPLADVLAKIAATPDFTSDRRLHWIHRHSEGADIYFVSNPSTAAVEAKCRFHAPGLQPEYWNPETGQTSLLATYQPSSDGIAIPLHFEPSGSVFVVFRKQPKPLDPVVSISRDGQPVFVSATSPVIQIIKATYGVPGDAARTRDMCSKLQAMLDRGVTDFQVADMAEGDDPAYGIVKTLSVDFTVDGIAKELSGQDPDSVSLAPSQSAPDRAADALIDSSGRLSVVAQQPGHYELKTSTGRTLSAEIAGIPDPVTITGAWDINFPPKWGAPERTSFEQLASWTDSSIEGVKYFSGTATYAKTFDWTAPKANDSRFTLDLGEVQVLAQVKLNGHDLGILWKAPFHVDITHALQPGRNTLEIRVANLWPNRMIGDQSLPESQRFTWSSWEPFTKDSPLLKSGLLGPVRIQATKIVVAR